jgi:phage-related protein
MSTLATLVVQIIGDVSGYVDTLKKADEQTASFSARAVGGLAAIGGGIVTGALATAGAGAIALGTYLHGAAGEAMEAEEISARLAATLANTSNATGVTARMVDELAQQYQGLTRYEDDVISSGAEVLARYKEIGSDIFPDALKSTLDMATAMKIDVPAAATLLGKTLAVPGEGLLKLKAAGVVFTDQQEEMIKVMAESGDQAGAMKAILDAVNGVVGGQAEAAGKTAAGMWERIGNVWGNIQERIGTGLVPALTNLGTMLMDYLGRPEIQAGIERLAQAIADFAAQAITNLPQVIAWFQQAFGWLQENEGVIVATLAVIGASIAAFVYTTVIPAAISVIAATWPVVLVVLLIAAAAWLLYEAWTNNWGGIQEKTAAVVAVVQAVVQNGLAMIQAFWAEHGAQIMAIVDAAWQFIQFIVNAAMNVIRNIQLAIQAAMRGDWHAFGQYLRQVFEGLGAMLAGVIQVGWSVITTAVKSLVKNVIDFFKSTDWSAVGKAIIEGIANGFRKAAAFLQNAALDVVQAVFDAIAGFLGLPEDILAGSTSTGGSAQSIPTASGVSSALPGAVAGGRTPSASAGGGVQLVNYGTIYIQTDSKDLQRDILRQLGAA